MTEAVAILEDVASIRRRVFGMSHPTVVSNQRVINRTQRQLHALCERERMQCEDADAPAAPRSAQLEAALLS